MTNDKEGWEDVNVSSQDKIEYEIENEEQKAEPVIEESAPEVKVQEEEQPKELEGLPEEFKGAEKRIRQLIKQRKDRDEQIQTLIAHNEQLTKNITLKDQELLSVNKLSLDASEKQLKDKAELAREVYLEAFDEGDKEKLLKAQEALNEAQSDLKQVTSAKIDYEDAPKEKVQPYQPPVTPVDNTKADEWAAKNNWFGQDSIRTAAALAVDAELKGEGFNPSDDEFYEQIDRRMQKAFPQNYSDNQERVQENTSSPAQVVAGSSRSSPTSNKRVKLSKEDVRLAEKWGIPLEQYASEKLKVSQADGEYTNVT